MIENGGFKDEDDEFFIEYVVEYVAMSRQRCI